MPTITITAVLFAYIMRMTRANVIEVMQTDYVRTAILKGLPMRQVILRYVLRNAMLPTITVITINFGYMLGGLINRGERLRLSRYRAVDALGRSKRVTSPCWRPWY